MPLKLHVLTIPSWYPNYHHPLAGIFFYEGLLALEKIGVRNGVINPQLRSLRRIINPLHFSETKENDDITKQVYQKFPTFSSTNINSVPLTIVQKNIINYQSKQLMQRYVETCGKPDIIHAQGTIYAGLAANTISRRWQIPYVVVEHSSLFMKPQKISQMKRNLTYRILTEAQKVCAVSNALAQNMHNLLPKDIAINIIPNMVNTDFFNIPKKRPVRKPHVFLTISFLNKNKGVDLLIRAFAKAFREQPAILRIGGYGSEIHNLKRLSQELEMQNQIEFLGLLSREKVRDNMHNAHTFISSSFHETFSIVLIEAMATGLRVIATKSGGPQDIIIDNRLGLLIEKNNIHTLSIAMVEEFNREFTLEDSQYIRYYTHEKYNSLVIAYQFKDMYYNVLKI